MSCPPLPAASAQSNSAAARSPTPRTRRENPDSTPIGNASHGSQREFFFAKAWYCTRGKNVMLEDAVSRTIQNHNHHQDSTIRLVSRRT